MRIAAVLIPSSTLAGLAILIAINIATGTPL